MDFYDTLKVRVTDENLLQFKKKAVILKSTLQTKVLRPFLVPQKP